VTEVMGRRLVSCALLLLLCANFAPAGPQSSLGPADAGPAEKLFLQLSSIGLDRSRVFRAREVSIDRGSFSIGLDDGTIGFTEDVAGRVTGAFFVGDGEILLTPPNQVERGSMAMFTGGAILEERITSAYFRFNDDTFADLRPSLRPAENPDAFVTQWNDSARRLAEGDALRLLVTFSHLLPGAGETTPETTPPVTQDRFLHARLQGESKGNFDVYFDSNAPEQVWAGQLKTVEGDSFYDVWTSFSLLKKTKEHEAANDIAAEEGRASRVDISDFKIRTEISPPTTINAEAVLQLQVRKGGQRTVIFELARSLVIKEVDADGSPVEFIHNPTIEGTQLARRGNDLVAVVFSRPLETGQKIALRFVYGGAVLAEAGPGLLYVGARGTWYPNRGFAMSNFDLVFRYPVGWTLVATGKVLEPVHPDGAVEQESRWISERPIPVAGFNLGRYQRVPARADNVNVDVYATNAVERGFPQPKPEVVVPDPGISNVPSPVVITHLPPSPARNAQMVATSAAQAIEVFSRRFGPYPYAELALTQMPGDLSQGWPGLIFLSSLSFLSADERSQLHLSLADRVLIGQVIAHETAHQWWGDLVMWADYRDQWLSEGLANYSSLMLLESEDPSKFRAVMEKYRDDLLEKNKAGVALMTDGPVTLGTRLSCSQFPDGYEAISYGRGTWLFHMLRYMLRDAEQGEHPGMAHSTEEPFVRGLRRARERFQGKPMTTRDLLQVFEEDLPRSLWYEEQKSLDWFYQGWINGSAVPRFELKGVKYLDKPGSTSVTGLIVQVGAPPDLVTPVPLYASSGGRSMLLGRVLADGRETAFHLSAAPGTRKMLIDPDHTLLSSN
jgi:Peptidase family M1 domain